MDEPADVTSKNRTRTHVLDQGSTTRNRKVVGSNPTSGSKTAGQRASPGEMTAQRQQAVIPLVGSAGRRRVRPARCVGVRPI
jgi:hypothetical protein